MRRRQVLLILGTDHHPFTRLVAWADQRQRAHPEERVVVQHGDTAAPADARGAAFLRPDVLEGLVADSHVVITHGGPGTIMGVRAVGHRPLVVPRDPAHGEHVDGHQQQFAAWARDKDLVDLVSDVDRLDARLDALGVAGTRVLEAETDRSAETVRRLQTLVQNPRQRYPAAPGATPVEFVVGEDPAARQAASRALVRATGGFYLGEITSTAPGAVRDLGCECGAAVTECPAWGALIGRAFGGWEDLERARADAGDACSGGFRTRLRTSRRHPGREHRRVLLRAAAAHRRLYEAARELLPGRSLVDSGSAGVLLTLSHDRHLALRPTAVRAQARNGVARVLGTSLALRRRGVAPQSAWSGPSLLGGGAPIVLQHPGVPVAAGLRAS